jgi:DNA-binding transcriptional ArsR family regulator
MTAITSPKTMATKKANADIKLANLAFNPQMLRKGLLTMRAINHPVRKELLKIIFKKKETTVTELFIALRQEQSVVSQHLAILRRIHVLQATRQGKNILYTVNNEELRRTLQFANGVQPEKGTAELTKDKLELGDSNAAYNAMRVLSHPLRLQLMEFIDKHEEINVNKIYNSLGLEQSITSQHLRMLREQNLVNTRKEGKKIFYSLNEKRLNQVANAMGNYFGANN